MGKAKPKEDAKDAVPARVVDVSPVQDTSGPEEALQLPEVDPASFLVPTRDDHGHNVRVQFRVHEQYAEQASKIVRAKKFPFQNEASLYRFCLDHGMRYLVKVGGVESDFAKLDQILEACRDDEMNSHFDLALDALRKRIDDHKGQGTKEGRRRAKGFVLNALERVKGIGEPYWRKRFVVRLQNEYRNLLNDGEKVKFSEMGDEDEGGGI